MTVRSAVRPCSSHVGRMILNQSLIALVNRVVLEKGHEEEGVSLM
jgi:hypothetical protein